MGPASSNPPQAILWSTQGGRAKACARRTTRILLDSTRSSYPCESQGGLPDGYYGSSFDDFGARDFLKMGRLEAGAGSGSGSEGNTTKKLVILFVSTTGDAEHCDSIKEFWKVL